MNINYIFLQYKLHLQNKISKKAADVNFDHITSQNHSSSLRVGLRIKFHFYNPRVLTAGFHTPGLSIEEQKNHTKLFINQKYRFYIGDKPSFSFIKIKMKRSCSILYYMYF